MLFFRQVLPKVLPVVHIFSFIITTYSKKKKKKKKKPIRIKSLSKKTVQQNYLPESYPLYLPSYQKYVTFFYLACGPYHVWTALPLFTTYHLRETLQMGEESRPAAKKCPFPTPEKSPSPIRAPFIAVVIAAVLFFLTSSFMYRYIMLILIS